jgi:hypothetical protein
MASEVEQLKVRNEELEQENATLTQEVLPAFALLSVHMKFKKRYPEYFKCHCE